MEAETPSLGRAAGAALRWNASAAVATLVSQLVQLVVLARWLTPAEFGLAAVALAVTGFMWGFADLGMTNALVQRESSPEKTWASAWWAAASSGAVLCVALVALAGGIATVLRLEGLAPLLWIAALSLPFFGPAAVFQARLQRQLRFKRLALGEIGAAVIALAVAVAWILWRAEPMALIAGQLALVGSRFVLLGALSGLRPLPRLQVADLRPLSGFGAFQMGERALNNAAGNLDRLLVAALLGPAAAGFYSMAAQIALKPAALFGPFVTRTLLPLLARMQGDRARMASAYLRSLSLLALPASVVYALLLGLADPLLRAVLGTGWEPAIPVLRVMAVLGFLIVMGNALGNLVLALGKAGVSFGVNVLVLTARVLAILAGSRYGTLGVAVAMLFVTVLTLPLDFELPRRWLGVAPKAIARAAGWALVPAIPAAWAASFLAARLSLSPALELVIPGLGAALLFVLVARLFTPVAAREALRDLREKMR